MVTVKTHWLTYAVAGLIALLFFAGIGKAPHAPSLRSSATTPLAAEIASAGLRALTNRDAEIYRDIFTAQEKGDWQTADKGLGRLNNPVLLGYVLADRYLHRDYVSSPKELVDWLEIYADLPQAHEIYALAQRKSASLAHIKPIQKPRSLQGYGDDNGLAASFGNSPHVLTWHQAISQWKKKQYAQAGQLFSKLLEDKKLPSWKASAAAYWSYRSFLAAKEPSRAQKFLHIAAQYPRSFYGVLARKKLGKSLDLQETPPRLEAKASALMSATTVQRIVALVQAHKTVEAEKELRILFLQTSTEEKKQLLALAHKLNLASVQIAMAKQLRNEEESLDYASYPVPAWQPKNGFKIDPALLYALVRQESGFYPHAVSPSGATGLMQIMPKTASYMKKRLYGNTLSLPHDEKDPTFNMALGQDYVEYLMENPLVEGNLFYLLAAYNAGPGRLMQWKKDIAHEDDPLLFVESIPFAETRHYVMQVMTNYWIYSELAGNGNKTAAAVLSGNWPKYDRKAAEATLSQFTAADNTG